MPKQKTFNYGFDDPRYIIKRGKYFTIIFRERMTTLGNCIFASNRRCPHMGQLKPEEMAEFATLARWYERKIKKLYGASRFNYVAFMMYDKFVHFHVIPRYEKPVLKYGIVWEDLDWPKMCKMKNTWIDQELQFKIIDDLRDEKDKAKLRKEEKNCR